MHHAVLSRANLLPAIGQVVSQIMAGEAPSTSAIESEPTPSASSDMQIEASATTRKIRADMKNPQLVVLVEVIKTVCGISIINGDLYEGIGRKWNLQAIAESLHQGEPADPRDTAMAMD